MSNDISNVTSANQGAVGKILPVQTVSPGKNPSENGNKLPTEEAIAERVVQLEEAANAEKLDDVVREINQSEQVTRREIHFSIDEDSGHTVIKVMDLSTQEVIRQMPNEEALQFARKLGEGADLNLIDEYT